MYNVFEKLNTLPVASLLDDISAHTLAGGISIVNSETGSGKSLLVPLRIQKDTNDTIIVVQPRRFLAINAAEILSSISETKLGEEFGYLIGHTGSGEENRFDHDKTKVAFVTYGFVLATKMIMVADRIVLDEIHEHSIDMAICKALIKYRYKTGNPPKSLVLMSATLDVEAETAYWSDVAETKVFSAGDGRKFKCIKRHEPATHPVDAALSLIENGRKGVLVFAPGIGEIKDILDEFEKRHLNEKYPNITISYIHGQSEYEDRQEAFSFPPEGKCKILIGTNVIESGMNLPWVDAGVSTGEKKELHVRTGSGAVVLTKVPLAKSNVDQQAGRTNRFGDSTFIICGQNSYDMMANAPTPEIERLPLTALYMHCQSIDIDPNDLQFMPQPPHDKMIAAATKLKNLGFFDKQLKLTHAGLFAQNLPVGLETAAMLYHANCMGILADVIPLAAVYEMGNIRKDHSEGHSLNYTSDVIDSVMAFTGAIGIQKNGKLPKHQKVELMERINVSMRRYIDTAMIVRSLEQRFKIYARYNLYQNNHDRGNEDSHFAAVRQCLLAASVCNMGILKSGLRGPMIVPAAAHEGYQISKGSVIMSAYKTVPASCKLRMITPRSGGLPFTVCEQVTQFSFEDIDVFGVTRPGVFTKRIESDGNYFLVNGIRYHYERVEPAFIEGYDWGNRGGHREYERPRMSSGESDTSLGSILKEAYARKKA